MQWKSVELIFPQIKFLRCHDYTPPLFILLLAASRIIINERKYRIHIHTSSIYINGTLILFSVEIFFSALLPGLNVMLFHRVELPSSTGAANEREKKY